MSRRAVAYINPQALRHNVQRVRQLAPRSSVLAMIKSNAYGHGLTCVAQQLEPDVGAFGVACLEEAISLRDAGVKTPLLVMSGFLDQQELALFIEYQIDAVIHQCYQIDLLEQSSANIKVWLKIDTGMHRLGFSVTEADAAYQRLANVTTLKKPIHIMSHLASADTSPDNTRRQIELFSHATKKFNRPKSMVNSAGLLTASDAHFDWVRPGILLYGVSPFAGRTGIQEQLQPVMTLTAKLIAIKRINKGAYVGYGAAWQSPAEMSIGLVAIGYGDGYPRHADSGTPTLINGQCCPLVGRVSMDIICVDLRKLPQAAPGMEVILWGDGLPVETIAQHAATIPYELLCGITQRVKLLQRTA